MAFVRDNLTEEEKNEIRQRAKEYGRGAVKIDWNREVVRCSFCLEKVDADGNCVCGIAKVKNEDFEKFRLRMKGKK